MTVCNTFFFEQAKQGEKNLYCAEAWVKTITQYD